MSYRIPCTTLRARIFDEVETVDPQYDIFDVGLEHADGGIDSIALGGSAYSLKKAIHNLNRRADDKAAAAAEVAAQ